ncbi:hypothetical protein EMPS_06921 [Entomortierella parvispora]|uniref:Mid2 domain-containing protein n=1 Tax=Entomortierella parvispora TaxID=205924 RepID=A0A9P3HDM4_9FUNG|nr:hypothetical protein EMPS_06921 [Entomortierella parvispora]
MRNHQNQPSRPQSSRRRNGISFLLATALTALLSTNVDFVQADIVCAKPVGGGIYSAGDIMTLDWTATTSGAQFTNLITLTATLACNDGRTIATLPVTDWTHANNWTVPSVGNATTAGGTTGTCLGNAFHVFYSGTYAPIPLLSTPWGPVSCDPITILPSPNMTVPTATTTTSLPTSTAVTTTTIRSTETSKGQTSSATPTPTNKDSDKDSSGPSTTIIVVVAIIAGLVLILLAFGSMWYLRRQKRRRMENAIMPWSNQPNNNFAKISSSTDDGPRSFGAASSVTGAGAYGVGKNKPLPPTGAYYEEDGYGYNDAHARSPPQGYGNYHQGYEGYEGYDQQGYEDEYYNPYYGQGGATPGPTAHRGPGSAYYNGGNQGDLYGVSSAVSPRVAGAAGAGGGYFPPPPPSSAARSPAAMQSAIVGNASLNSLPLTSSSTMLTSSSSTRRAPQLIVAPTPEEESSKTSGVSSPTLASGGTAGMKEEQDKGIPMQDLAPSSSSPR